jgi:luciferase family oxidoreductase group 1
MIPFSILDLSPIVKGGNAEQSLRNSLDLAQHAEKWGYKRYWVAEHHNMPGIASAATAVVIGYIAGGTQMIRVGAGGIMLPNHAPLVIAEQFGTLASLYPNRIDLGLGRAPGTDGRTAMALRRSSDDGVDSFPRDVIELQSYLAPARTGQRVKAVPGQGTNVPIWLLGSSLYSAMLAANFGLPFAFASHFAPEQMMEALHVYKTNFQPSEALPKPYCMVGAGLFAADTDEEARFLFTSLQQSFASLRSGKPISLPPPVESLQLNHLIQEVVDQSLSVALVGSRATIKEGLAKLIERTQPNEIIFTAQIYDHAARLKSFEILSEIMGESETRRAV